MTTLREYKLELAANGYDTALSPDQMRVINLYLRLLNDDEDPCLHIDYSGRCMFNITCMGISIRHRKVSLRGRTASTDSMGLDTIYYWPSIPGLKRL